ncbi:histidine phosphatase family protein [Pedobacter cryoconitis]|uniref:Putative phosphoglycerate mutase n=1 Tax=Pedobacter cryoconitis TaxID=188932 RepID=A0A7X0MHA6_9SPHI|nr:histidine phosphatase family protein [Pedobacter cryoconitis]MBB6498934.1 putative phosphoglycerate mutase [Pedobacter cryoconitis]
MDKEIYIIRHGETDLNKQGIIQGRGIDSDLNDTGRAQAAAFYNKYKDFPFDKVYTSALKRTQQTIQQFIDAGLPWEKHPQLDELAWGEWEGKQTSEVAIGAFKDMTEKWQSGDYQAHFKGGESPADVAVRLKEIIEVIKSRTAEKKILICMHGRSLRLLLCLLSNRPMSEMYNYPHQNTGLYKIELTGDTFTITDRNNTDHLNA